MKLDLLYLQLGNQYLCEAEEGEEDSEFDSIS
jgi:hypothetical protein